MNSRDFAALDREHKEILSGKLPQLGKPGRAGYRWASGYVADGSGKPTTWREYLGADPLLAMYRAREMTCQWAMHVLGIYAKACIAADRALPIETVKIPPMNRATVKAAAWAGADRATAAPAKLADQANEKLAEALSPGFKLVPVPMPKIETSIVPGQEQQTPPAVKRLHAALDSWAANLDARAAKNDCSADYALRIRTVTIKRIKEATENLEIEQIRFEQLDSIRLAFQSKKTWARGTIRRELALVKTFFGWLDEREDWTPCRRWKKALTPIFRNEHHAADPAEKSHDTYSIKELGELYENAGYSMKLWLLCGLNFAWGATEIATARKSHFKAIKPELRRVSRFRHKNKPGAPPVPGKWQAWPETWAAAIERINDTPDDKKTNPDALAFLTAQGKPLVRISGKRRYDAIAEAFGELCEVAGVRCRGFYLLRHTGVNLMKTIGGQEMADLYSQHAPETISAKHYENANWKGLRRCLRKMRAKLSPMFNPVVEKDKAKPKRSKVAA